MKKLSLFLIYITILVILTACSPAPNLSFAEKIIVNYKTNSQNSGSVEITDAHDIEAIVNALTTDVKNGSGNCEFSLLELIFEGNDKSLILFPTPESCGTVKIAGNSDKYYIMSESNRESLFEILNKYGIVYNLPK